MGTELDPHQQSEVIRIRERISNLIQKHFSTGSSTYYVSQLGNELSGDLKTLERITRQKLSKFLEREFPFEIGRTGTHNNVLYLIAADATNKTPTATIPRYHSRLWAAFAAPIGEAERRFLDLTSFQFDSNLEALRSGNNEVREIGREYLSSEANSRTSEQINEQIVSWSAAQNLDLSRFLLSSRRMARVEGENLLTELINALDKDQLKRVTLPLDVVRTLSSTQRN